MSLEVMDTHESSRGDRGRNKLPVIIIMLTAALAISSGLVFQYNRFNQKLTVIKSRQADIDRELQRRANLIPNLVKVTKNYLLYEEDICQYIADAGFYKFVSSMPNNPAIDLSNDHAEVLSKMLFSRNLAQIVFLEICYLNLRGTAPVNDLMKEAADTENRIIKAKKEYNKACQEYNVYRWTFPGKFCGSLFGFDAVAYLGAGNEALEMPDMELDIGPVPEFVVAPDLHFGVFKAMMPDMDKRASAMNAGLQHTPDMLNAETDIIITAILMTIMFSAEKPEQFKRELGANPL